MTKARSNDKTRRMVFTHAADPNENGKVACFFTYDQLCRLGSLLDGSESYVFEETMKDFNGDLTDPKNPYYEEYEEVTTEISWVLKSIFDGTPSQKVDPDDYISALEPNSDNPKEVLNKEVA